ncbi:hypothetical protein DSO57_1016987 [Entomophthora muscae]|uniref:Uncharacterized protein n=1 Tax=Entomophthora muscae TaxID=34485 RepID=A0ACC2RJG2_9FUNG|nr:hypothetical protein DSO57_1016987 [Entomophthora muscae]
MNYIIFTAVLTAYLGIGGHQPTNAQFGPEPQGPKGILYNKPAHLNSMVLNLWRPLASSHPTPNLATYVIPAATLLYLAISLRQCNILAKAFCQAVNFYPIVYALNGFEPPNLPSYVTKFLPSILGYYTYLGLLAPVLERLAVVADKVAVDSMAATWPALYMLMPSDLFSNFPLQVICLLKISTSIFCYTTIGSKMLNLSSQFGLLLVKQLTICLLYPHCISLNHAAYHFTLTNPAPIPQLGWEPLMLL